MSIVEQRLKPCALPKGRCLAGFSGGADSTALIMILAAEKEEGLIEPEAIHVNHGLRGNESEQDEAFCRELCMRLNIPLRTVRADTGGRTDENACREARFLCFREAMDETGIHSLVLAHNRDDVTETFMMRLMRGAGVQGLACMSPRDEREGYVIYRPLLHCGREEIRRTLREAGIPWREDSLNRSDKYLRNRVREQLIPMMEEMTPGAAEHIAQAAAVLTRENLAMQEETDRYLAAYSRDILLETDALQNMPDAFAIRILRTWWQKNTPLLKEHALNARQTEELLALARSGRGKMNLPGGLFAVKGRNGIYISGLTGKTNEEVPFESEEVSFGAVTLRRLPSLGNPGDGVMCQEAPEAYFRGCVIRTRRPGDRIRPFGMEGTRKLQDYLTDRGIDEPWRDRIPLLCRGQEVILAAGVGAGAIPRWRADADNIRIEWTGEMPWRRNEREARKR